MYNEVPSRYKKKMVMRGGYNKKMMIKKKLTLVD